MNQSANREFEMLALFEMTPDLVCIVNKDGYFKKVNPAVINTLQYDREEIYSQPVSNFIHPDDREITSRQRKRLLAGKPLLNFQNRYLTRQGDTVWLEWTSLYLPEKEVVFAIAKNITANKRKEEEFAGKISTYKALVHHFKNRAEEDRRWLAFELHEDVAQLAAALKWQTNMLQEQIAGYTPDVAAKFEEVISISDRLVKAIRRISFSISPGMLDDLGFHETMEWMCREFTLLNGIRCDFSSPFKNDQISSEIRTEVFRACQQMLLTIGEQAAATFVMISLEQAGDKVVVNIYTDGTGIRSGPGLLNIQQLSSLINANVTIENVNGSGTRVILQAKNNL